MTEDRPDGVLRAEKENVERAMQVVGKAIVQDMMNLPPYLAVELPCIRRCLKMLSSLITKEMIAAEKETP